MDEVDGVDGVDGSTTVSHRVVKLGGSLLDLPDLVHRVTEWFEAQSPARHVVIVGGGPFVDALRLLQPRLPLNDADLHWLAIRGMSVAAQFVQSAAAAIGHAWPIVSRVDKPAHEVVLLDAEPMLCHAHDDRLPEDWSVTSDSIAAWIAIHSRAAELVLLKSHLAEMSPPFVDACFASLVDRLTGFRIVNLRAWPPAERVIRGPG